jgi:hypothetical protein
MVWGPERRARWMAMGLVVLLGLAGALSAPTPLAPAVAGAADTGRLSAGGASPRPGPNTITTSLGFPEGRRDQSKPRFPGECSCPVDYIALYFFGSTACTIAERAVAEAVQQTTGLDVATFRRVRDELLPRSSTGRRYAGLYAAHGREIVRLLAADAALRAKFRDGLLLWQDDLAALLDGRADGRAVTSEQALVVQDVLAGLAASGSPALRQTIQTEQAARPLGQLVGMSVSAASSQITSGGTVDYLPSVPRRGGASP